MSGKTMKVYHHNRMIMEIEEHLEKLQNQLFLKCGYINWKGEPAFLCTVCPFYHGFKKGCVWKKQQEVLGLGNVEKETK